MIVDSKILFFFILLFLLVGLLLVLALILILLSKFTAYDTVIVQKNFLNAIKVGRDNQFSSVRVIFLETICPLNLKVGHLTVEIAFQVYAAFEKFFNISVNDVII